MRTFHLLLFIAFCIFVSCDSNESDAPNFEDLDVVTGITLTDFNGAPIGTWNQPNDKAGEVSIFPNPFSGQLFLQSPVDIERIWILPANCNTTDLSNDIPELSQNISHSLEDIEEASIKNFPLIQLNNNNMLALNLEDINEGFYKLFYETTSGDIRWINTCNFTSYPDPSNINSALDDLCQ